MVLIQQHRSWFRQAATSAVAVATVTAALHGAGGAALAAETETTSSNVSAIAAAVDPVDESQDFRFPGADTMVLPDGSNQYITYGASAGGRKVPYTISGSGSTPAASPTITGDAWDGVVFPDGYWAKRDSNIWTPGAWSMVKGDTRYYFLFYTAVVAGTVDKHCVGVARATRPGGPFRTQQDPIACPTRETRWAIDADVTQGPQGAIWMTWRDGERATEGTGESALSVVMLAFSDTGVVTRNNTPSVILRSDNLTWPHYRDTGVTVIENPSAFHVNGSWYLFYSGNSFKTGYYATGVAHCGSAIEDNLCAPMPGPNRAYFSYAGPRAENVITGPSDCADRYNTEHYPDDMRVRGLPGNKRSPGAIDVYQARDGQFWVTWNYRSDSNWCNRKSRLGRLVVEGSGSNATFRVNLV